MPAPPLIDADDFVGRVLTAYEGGTADRGLPADSPMARSLMPPSTSAVRDFWSMSHELPEFIPDACVGCLECVTECPDTAILARVVPEPRVAELCNGTADAGTKAFLEKTFARVRKYGDNFARQGKTPGRFGLFIDPAKCKGCGECVVVCGDRGALRMVKKSDTLRKQHQASMEVFRKVGDTPKEYLLERSVMDMMLSAPAVSLFCGGAGSCMGCGEATSLRMMLSATGFVHGTENIGIVAATGCNTVYSSTYPHNPFRVPWTNSLFENACTVAMGVRLAWDRRGWQEKRLWAIGGDGAIFDIGFQSLSRMLASGMDIKVMVLDTQVYSNTGGQSSTSTFPGQEAKYSAVGSVIAGKTEARKELGLLAMMHPNTFVAQTTAAHPNHFYKAIKAANEFRGPAVIITYATCQPEHGVGDDQAYHQAKLAVESRAFPIYIHDPRKGAKIKERLDLSGNPAPREDWTFIPKTGETIDFITFAKTEGRFARQFDAEGKPSAALLAAKEERLENWRRLQELAGLR
ncbi:MAG: thiamine pyrophosphate-binding protein [Planctomycetes bacterium]|nr:thiamine pyrophosphate-binding protein [Planctomycetota bacterium]